ncbi:MAG: hypothetical protein LBF26_00550 [Puniceicoccales bacterium]|jgi:hypothetical protein|nr:hypothetical protein [Puniceicoccales bacterium]
MKQATLTVRIDGNMRKILEINAAKMNISQGALIRRALETYCRPEIPHNKGDFGHITPEKNDPKIFPQNINPSLCDGPKTSFEKGDFEDDGLPIYKLSRDQLTRAWTMGPYECEIKVCRNVFCAWEKIPNSVTIRVRISNSFLGKIDDNGIKAHMVTTYINSDTWGGKRWHYANTYEEALANMNLHEEQVGKRLQCHFDLSALAVADDIRRLFNDYLADNLPQNPVCDGCDDGKNEQKMPGNADE